MARISLLPSPKYAPPICGVAEVDDDLVVDAQHGGTDGGEADGPVAVDVGCERAADVRAERRPVDGGIGRVVPQERQPVGDRGGRAAELVAVAHLERTAHRFESLLDAATRLVHERDPPRRQRLGGLRRPVDADAGAATALHLAAFGVGAHERDGRAGRERQQVVLVLEQHRAADGRAADDPTRLGVVERGLVGAAFEDACPVHQAQQPADGLVDARLGGQPLGDLEAQLLAALTGRSRHLDVEPGLQ